MADDRYARYAAQMRFSPVGANGQRLLAKRTALIVGMGALGTVIASHLVRAGVGKVRFIDRDFVEESNLQRQLLFDEDDARASLPKAIAAQRKLERVNSTVELEAIVGEANASNIAELLAGADIALDGSDNFAARLLLSDGCFKYGVPYVYGGVVGSGGMLALLEPGRTACLRCLIGEPDGAAETCAAGGVLAPASAMIASLQAGEAIKHMVGDSGALNGAVRRAAAAAHSTGVAADDIASGTSAARGSLLTIDLWPFAARVVPLSAADPACPSCGLRQYPSLLPAAVESAEALCGSSAVYIRSGASFELAEWERRLAAVADVRRNPYLVKAALPEGERLVLYPDGRVLVQGTEDVQRAKMLYAKYIERQAMAN